MNFQQLLQDALKPESLGLSLWAFRPELVVCATILLLLLVRMLAPRWKTGAFYVMLIGTAAALLLAIPWHLLLGNGAGEPVSIFTGLLVFDTFSIYMRCLLLLLLLLFTAFTQMTSVPHPEDATEFYVLVLGATLGMCLMVSAQHMLMVFLGIEMASVPSYVLAGLLRDRRPSGEAALKYALFGAATAGIMLYGISLLVGTLGSAHLPTMAVRLAKILLDGAPGGQTMVLMLGGLMVMVGLAFRLSAVPFCFWLPDVFEGATAEVAAFLSIAGKAAALALLLRLALGFGYVPKSIELPSDEAVAAVAQVTEAEIRVAALRPARKYICGLIALLAAVTCTFGNLAAYGQRNMKRLLAYSTIAHAGYMMMPVAAAVALRGEDPAGAQKAVAALAFYIGVYLFMNLGAFAMVAFVRNVLHSEAIADYAGLIRRSPGLAVCTSIILFSLVGLPPLAGFAAKLAVFAPLANAGPGLLALLVVGGLNVVLSLFYSLRVVKLMTWAPEPENRPAPQIPLASIPGAYCTVLTVPVVVLGVWWWWGGLFDWALAVASFVLF